MRAIIVFAAAAACSTLSRHASVCVSHIASSSFLVRLHLPSKSLTASTCTFSTRRNSPFSYPRLAASGRFCQSLLSHARNRLQHEASDLTTRDAALLGRDPPAVDTAATSSTATAAAARPHAAAPGKLMVTSAPTRFIRRDVAAAAGVRGRRIVEAAGLPRLVREAAAVQFPGVETAAARPAATTPTPPPAAGPPANEQQPAGARAHTAGGRGRTGGGESKIEVKDTTESAARPPTLSACCRGSVAAEAAGVEGEAPAVSGAVAQKTAISSSSYGQAWTRDKTEDNTDGDTMQPAETPLIGTHNGTFHADEVLATVMLLSLPEYKDAKLLRSRDPAALAACSIVVDVGAEYCVATRRFDHHQKSFTTTFYDDENKQDAAATEVSPAAAATAAEATAAAATAKPRPVTKLSSAGLIYKHFGKRVLQHRYGICDEEILETVYQRLYRTFVEAVDAIDNGVSVVPGGGPLAYRDTTNLSSRIGSCNPPWNYELLREKYPEDPLYNPEKTSLYPVEIQGGDPDGNAGFRKAMQLAAEALDAAARGIVDVWLPAREIVAAAVRERHTVHPSGRMIKLKQWCPFEDHVFLLEKEMNIKPLLYCLYPDRKDRKEVGWRIRAIGVEGHMLESRLPLSSRFRGLRGSELGSVVCRASKEELVNVNIKPDEFIHCHATGFIAGTTALDAAVALGALTMEEAASVGSLPS